VKKFNKKIYINVTFLLKIFNRNRIFYIKDLYKICLLCKFPREFYPRIYYLY